MRAVNDLRSWGWVSRAFHWTMAAIILFQLGLGVWMTNFVPDLARQFTLTQLHKSWGFVVFILAIARVIWRLANRASPNPPATMPAWQRRGAETSHWLLYGLIFVLPLSGWAMSAASPIQDMLNIDNMVFGAFAMPDPWVPGVKAVADTAAQIHFAAALLLTLVLAIHIGAALKHQLIDRDDVLTRMTWGRR